MEPRDAICALYLDTSTPLSYAALFFDQKELFSLSNEDQDFDRNLDSDLHSPKISSRKKHDTWGFLHRVYEKALTHAPAPLTHLHLGLGPGSYTGLRVALSFAYALYCSSSLELCFFASLELFLRDQQAQAWGRSMAERGSPARLIALRDARSGGIYLQELCFDPAIESKGASQPRLLEPVRLLVGELVAYLEKLTKAGVSFRLALGDEEAPRIEERLGGEGGRDRRFFAQALFLGPAIKRAAIKGDHSGSSAKRSTLETSFFAQSCAQLTTRASLPPRAQEERLLFPSGARDEAFFAFQGVEPLYLQPQDHYQQKKS